jgi:hypothetical protein
VRAFAICAVNALRVLAVALPSRSRYIDEGIFTGAIARNAGFLTNATTGQAEVVNRLGRFVMRYASLHFDLDTSGRTSA